MLLLTLITASLLVGTVGAAMSGDPAEDLYDDSEDQATGTGDDDYRGTVGSDQTDGSSGDDLLSSYHASDTLEGGDGNDKIAGGAQGDVIRGGGGDDALSGGTGADEVFGDAGNDRVLGGSDSDEVWGGAGDDFVSGGGGADFVVGGRGVDILRGGAGNDILIGADLFREDIEKDDLADTNFENVIVYSDDLDEVDAINADEGDDTIIVGKGDVVIAGEGRDTVITGTWAAENVPVLTDFEPGADQILITVDAGQDLPTALIEVDGDDALIKADDTVVLRVLNGAGVVKQDDIALHLALMTERSA